MRNIVRLCAFALALVIAAPASTPAFAETHNLTEFRGPANAQYNRLLQQLSMPQLRRLVTTLNGEFKGTGNSAVRSRLIAARQELDRRRNQPAARQPVRQAQSEALPEAEGPARRILQNARANPDAPPAELRKRIGEARAWLKSKHMYPETRQQLHKLLRADLNRLQRLQKAQSQPQSEPLPEAEGPARRILQNARANPDAPPAELRNRIRDARAWLKSRHMYPQTRRQLQQQLEADVRRLRQLQEARDTAAADEESARELLGGVDSGSLSPRELQNRISQIRTLLSGGNLSRGTEQQLKRLMARDRQAMKRIESRPQVARAEADAQALLDGATPSNRLDARQLRQRIGEARALMKSDELRPRTRRQLNQLIGQDQSRLEDLRSEVVESDAERQARRLLAEDRAPGDMDVGTLGSRVRETRNLLDEEDISRRTRNRLQARLDSYVDELRQRRAERESEQSTDAQALELLADRRPAEELRERELRQRLRQTRDVLQSGEISGRLSRRLRNRLAEDRQELRRRVQAQRDQDEDVVVTLPPANDESFLAEGRSADELSTRELSRRIKRATARRAQGNLTPLQSSRLDRMIRDDRRELRSRLRERRQRRQSELERLRRRNELNVVIAPQIQFEPRSDVAAAEADDDVIEQQLVAAPTREIDRRYTLEEFRRRPHLRRYMPAIEVDSIHFGFNEHWVREEEVDELERIGAAIEKVVAANPDEVFLIEGHTDAVGSESYNLELSRKRAQAVRDALVEFFVIPDHNVATIGYGEQFLKIPTPEEEQENRRVSVRRITPLLARR